MNFAAIPRSRYLSERFRARLVTAVLLSLLAHGFLLSLQFGIPGLGLPGLDLPWNQRRAPTPQLEILLANVAPATPPVADVPMPVAIVAPPLPTPPVNTTTPLPDTASFKLVAPRPTPVDVPAPQVRKIPPKPKFHPRIITRKTPAPDAPTVAPDTPDIQEQSTERDDTPEKAEEVVEAPTVEPAVEAQAAEKIDEAQEKARLAQEQQALKSQALAAAKLEEQNAQRQAAEAEAARKQADEAASRQAEALAQQQALALEKQKAAEVEVARRAQEAEAKKQEEASKQQLAMEQEKRRQAEEETRQAAALALQKQADQKREEQEIAHRAEIAELKKQEEIKAERLAAELQAQKQAEELARQKAALAQKMAAERAAAEKALADARRDSEAAKALEEGRKSLAANAPTAGGGDSIRPAGAGGAAVSSAVPLASRALEQIRKNDLFRKESPVAKPFAGPSENSGRRSIFGSLATDVSVTMYVESWRLKIERNGSFNYSQSSKDRVRGDPVVTVIVRSDGSVEDVIIHHTSGRPDIDEAVHRIVRLNTRFAAFPPDLARKYDVIEIRRIWSFDDRLRLLEEVR